jgi:hypothetical protein
MATTTTSNLGGQQGVSLPGEVKDFIQTISECYGHRDIDQIMRRVSGDFLHQGMDRTAFGECLKQSYLLKYVEWMKTTILRFRRDANIAELAGFAETNLGIMPASEESLPLIEGSKLILESGEWKLLGNQSKSVRGLYHAFHQLSAYFVPEDTALYRSLLPAHFEVPLQPMVFVKVADNDGVYSPLPPYKMAHVQILAEYRDLQGWYTLTMPETDWIPVEMGRTIGYPKYVADSIKLGKSNSSWTAEVVNGGDNAISLSLEFEADPSQASWFERVSSKPPMILLRKLLPPFKEKPWFLMVPIGAKEAEDQALLLSGDPLISGVPRVQETFGRVRLSMETNQPWAGLFTQEIMTRGVLMQFSGQLLLRHRAIAVLKGTSNSA